MDSRKLKIPFRRLSSSDIEPDGQNGLEQTPGNRKTDHFCSECANVPRFSMLRPSVKGLGQNGPPSQSASNTQLSCLSFTDSVSPRVSLDNLTLGEDSRDNDTDGNNGKRILNSREYHLTPTDRVNHRFIPFLSPNPHHKMTSLMAPGLVSRSTSCPSMANNHRNLRSNSRVTSPTSPKNIQVTNSNSRNEKPHFGYQSGMNGVKNSNFDAKHEFKESASQYDRLHNHVLKSSMDKEDSNGTLQDNHFEQRPMHTRRLNGSRNDWRITDTPPSYVVPEAKNKCKVLKQSYVNIGDIPTYLTQKVISERKLYRDDSAENARTKCLQWLSSLDSDED